MFVVVKCFPGVDYSWDTHTAMLHIAIESPAKEALKKYVEW